MAEKLKEEQVESTWLCDALDANAVSGEILLRWLDGIDWPDQDFAEPYRMILDLLPLRKQNLPEYKEALARVAAATLRDLIARDGYPPEEIRHRALNELFYLCTCLSTGEILAEPLADYHRLVAERGLRVLEEPTRFALRLALERNQVDARLERLWWRMIEGEENFLPGTWEDGFAALGRALHAVAVQRNAFSTRSARIVEFRPYDHFRAAVAILQRRLEILCPDGEQAARALEAAVERWNKVCPALRVSELIFDACYRPETKDWARRGLERCLKAEGIMSFEEILVARAESLGCQRAVTARLPELLQEAHDDIESHRLEVITYGRLWNVATQTLNRQFPAPSRPPSRHASASQEVSKAKIAGMDKGHGRILQNV